MDYCIGKKIGSHSAKIKTALMIGVHHIVIGYKFRGRRLAGEKKQAGNPNQRQLKMQEFLFG
jgi:hypothetical protein